MKKNSSSGVQNQNVLFQELAEELRKKVLGNFKNHENIHFLWIIFECWSRRYPVIKQFNKGIHLIDKKGITITIVFQRILN